jgi:hypothetical protein
MGLSDWLRGRRPARQQSPAVQKHDAEMEEQAYRNKKLALERILGSMDDTVGHALIPFCVGGALDRYYFSKAMPGTVFVTMELIEPDGTGPQPSRMGTYELVACTRLSRVVQRKGESPDSEAMRAAYEETENRLWGILNSIASYSYQAVLGPGETAEIPGDKNNYCVLFDQYPLTVPFEVSGRLHGLLLVIEVYRSEMEYAMAHGSAGLLEKLKMVGAYPYADLDRTPVV